MFNNYHIKQMLIILILLALWSQGVGIWQQSFLITMCCKIILPVLDVINIACLINQSVLFFVTDQQRGGPGIFIVLVLEDVTCVWVISVPSMIDMEVYMQTVLIFSVHVLDQSMISDWNGLETMGFRGGDFIVLFPALDSCWSPVEGLLQDGWLFTGDPPFLPVYYTLVEVDTPNLKKSTFNLCQIFKVPHVFF